MKHRIKHCTKAKRTPPSRFFAVFFVLAPNVFVFVLAYSRCSIAEMATARTMVILGWFDWFLSAIGVDLLEIFLPSDSK